MSDRAGNRLSWVAVVMGLLTLGFSCGKRETLGEPPDPGRVAERVERVLVESRAVAAHKVDVDESGGMVSLSGSVDSLLAKEHATAVVERVKGVVSVRNFLEVSPSPHPDGVLRELIASEISRHPALAAQDVRVSVKQAVAVLEGGVDTLARRELAAAAVRNIRGVRALSNNLSIAPDGARPDAEIAREIEEIFHYDPWIDEENLAVDVSRGVVKLSGRVGSAAERTRAARRAAVHGALEIDAGGIHVQPWRGARENRAPRADDAPIESAVRAAMKRDPRILSRDQGEKDIAIHSRDGVVTLTGVARTLTGKRAMEEIAASTRGVSRVINLVKVRPARNVGDATLRDRVTDVLRWDPYLERNEIGVRVSNGKVFLNGLVGSYFLKSRATQVAARVNGVLAVENNIRVDRSELSDEILREEILTMFQWDPLIEIDKLSVTSRDGRVTLAGNVGSAVEMALAVQAVLEAGAETVVNNLRLD